MAVNLPQRFYENVKTQYGKTGEFSFITAEAETTDGRQHRRLLAFNPGNPVLNGKPVLYADTYLSASEPTTYVYARHRTTPSSFFAALDKFISVNFTELTGRKFPVTLNVGGQALDLEIGTPFTPKLPLQHEVRFCRVFLPFGDVAVEFGPAVISDDQFVRLAENRMSSALESPLIGCDLTKSTIHASLMASMHWATGQIPLEILVQLIGEFTPQFV